MKTQTTIVVTKSVVIKYVIMCKDVLPVAIQVTGIRLNLGCL